MTRQTATLALLVVTLGPASACSDGAGPGRTESGAGLVVSQLVSQPAPANRNGPAPGSAAAFATGVVYVSLVPGTVPTGQQATIRNQATGQVLTKLVVNGGFDPVALAAGVGDSVVVDVTPGQFETRDVVRPIRPPRVVRTSPPSGGHDVPLNSMIVIVFSDPIDSLSLTTGSVQLWQGATSVAGTVRPADPAGIRAVFQPDSPLTSGTAYRLVVTQAIRDVNGLTLDADLDVTFMTGTQAAAGLVFASVSAGQIHSCGLTTVGVPYCWGDNVFGEIGDGTKLERLTPFVAMGGRTLASLSAGDLHNCGRATAGVAYCWGDNSSGQLGSGDTTGRTSAIATLGGMSFAAVSAGGSHSCGLTTAGVAFCWGANSSGELGVGDTTMRTTPVQVLGALRFAQVSAGAHHTCGVTTAGAAYCWGDNSLGELGDSIGGPLFPYAAKQTSPVAVVGGLSFAAVSAGFTHTCGVTTAGLAYCWGNGSAVGDGAGDTVLARSNPVAVVGGFRFLSVSAGWAHTCGVATSNLAYCWGDNSAGQLGDGTKTERNSPVEVLGGLRFVMVSAGAFHTCGVTTEGTVYCWGGNDFGTLGDATIDTSFAPVRVAP